MTYLPGVGGFFMEGLTLVEQPTDLRARVANASSITAPLGIRAGDLLVMVDHAVATGYATPSGWNTLASLISNTGQLRHQVHWRTADGTEGGTSVTGMSTSSADKIMIGFRGNKSMRSVPSTWTPQYASGNPSPQNIDAQNGLAPVLAIASYGSGNVIDPRTMSPAKDGEYGSANGGVYLAWKIYLANPQQVTVDMDNEYTGFNYLTSGYFALS